MRRINLIFLISLLCVISLLLQEEINDTTKQKRSLSNKASDVNIFTNPTIVSYKNIFTHRQDALKIEAFRNSGLSFSTNSDGDGIIDDVDLDDDNDGILDFLEMTNLTNVAVTNPNPTTTVINSGVTITIAENTPITTGVYTDSGVGFAGLEPRQGARFTYNFSPYVLNLKLLFADLDNREYLKINYYDKNGIRVVNATSFITANNGSPKNISFDSSFSLLIDTTNNAGGVNNGLAQSLEVTIPFEISKVEVTYSATPASGTYSFPDSTPEVYIRGLSIDKDKDADGIPNRLDLDSDNDGCVDAYEGDENVTLAQLVTAAGTVGVGLGSSADNLNLCANGTCVNAQGVPTLVNSGGVADSCSDLGQGEGSSYDASNNICVCTNNGNFSQTGEQSITGISDLQGFTNGWPYNVPNGFIVMQSRNSGFVITRVNSSANILAPVEGMLIYDIQDACIKLYNGTNWSCIDQSCNYVPIVQPCP